MLDLGVVQQTGHGQVAAVAGVLDSATWIGQAIRRGIDSGEFADCDVDATSTLLLALCDGFGIRLMLGGPKVGLDRAQAAIWGQSLPHSGCRRSFPRCDRREAAARGGRGGRGVGL
ncbi:TetR family transcriptional regulator C-terminal domain-containing protein [Streptomyces sp. NPDC019443]|uniref:TetR family transcriptional regulator C-terminal domain-containing protein n=1 Tax=Streptomyces sp. NPDC019443 TaxID=3365061 RepID=UPI0037B85B3B